MSVRETVANVFDSVAREQNRRIVPLRDDVPLIDIGLDSLCMAVIVARLESVLGRDPFGDSDEMQVPTTFGEFVAMYELVA